MTAQIQTQDHHARVEHAHRPRRAFPWGRIIAWFFMGLLLFVTIFPFYWMVRTALTAPRAVFLDTTSILPVQATLINFQRVLGMVDAQTAVAMGGSAGSIDFLRALTNSIVVSALVVAAAIPLTVALTFTGMHLLGIPLHQISIAALIIALGMLVDDPVVASDAINRELAGGLFTIPGEAGETGQRAVAVSA